MNEPINSDDAMAAIVFNHILCQIQNSSLNFRLELSPFSAVISLKKTFIKDKSGLPLTPANVVCSDKYSTQDSLANEVSDLKDKYEKIAIKYSAACDNILVLEKALKEKEETIQNLEAANTAAVAAATKLNKAVTEQRCLHEQERNNLVKEYKGQVKLWKKELGQLNRKHINLQRKFEHSQMPSRSQTCPSILASDSRDREPDPLACTTEELKVRCSICSNEIVDYVPDYFCGLIINPACDDCKKAANLFIEDQDPDPYSSFPDYNLPPSLISHWIPPHSTVSSNLLNLPSLRAHYVHLPNPGSSFLSMDEVFQEFKRLMDEYIKTMRNHAD